MLLTVSMASIPCLSRQPTSNIKDLKQSLDTIPTAAGTPALQYFNIRVTERLHRYRSMKRQWNEVASNGQYDLSKSDTLASITEMTPITHDQLIKDYITTSTLKEKDPVGNNPLRSQIQSDLMHLRKLIKSRQKKRSEKVSSKGNTHHRPSGENSSTDDQDKSHTRKNNLNQVKISGSQMRPSTFPQTPSSPTNLRQSSSNWSNPPRQGNNQHIFNNYRSRLHQQSLPLDSLIQGVPPPQNRISTPPKMVIQSPGKAIVSYRLPLPSVNKKKETTFIKSETHHLPAINSARTTDERTTTHRYTYAGSTSSSSPQSMKQTRESSLLPILLHSSSCIGIPPSGKSHETHELVEYRNLLHLLPKPVISTNGRGDYGNLSKQLDHIRQTMPNCHTYENYTRGY